jgi:hypothetical protein
VTSDYADPRTLATSPTLQGEKEDCGTTVRFWKLSDLTAGPAAIAQLPVGNGREGYFRHNAPEGVMSVALTHLHEHKGVFVTTMGGGAIRYVPDATTAEPEFPMILQAWLTLPSCLASSSRPTLARITLRSVVKWIGHDGPASETLHRSGHRTKAAGSW